MAEYTVCGWLEKNSLPTAPGPSIYSLNILVQWSMSKMIHVAQIIFSHSLLWNNNLNIQIKSNWIMFPMV